MHGSCISEMNDRLRRKRRTGGSQLLFKGSRVQRWAPGTSNAAALILPRLRERSHTGGGNECDPGQRQRGPLPGTDSKRGSSLCFPPRRRVAARVPTPQPGTVTHPALTRPLFPPHRTRPAALTSRPDPAETQLRYRRKSANGSDGRARPRAAERGARPPRSMRRPPGAMLGWGGLKPARSRFAQELKGDPWHSLSVELSYSKQSWGLRFRGVV